MVHTIRYLYTSELGGGEREEDLVTHDEFSWIVPYNSVKPSPLSICDQYLGSREIQYFMPSEFDAEAEHSSE